MKPVGLVLYTLIPLLWSETELQLSGCAAVFDVILKESSKKTVTIIKSVANKSTEKFLLVCFQHEVLQSGYIFSAALSERFDMIADCQV